MKDLITEIVQALVDQPDHVLVTEIEGDHAELRNLNKERRRNNEDAIRVFSRIHRKT